MAEVAEKRWTVEQFLDWDDGTDRRHELVDGRIVAMAPPSEAHAAIVFNLARRSAPSFDHRAASSASSGSGSRGATTASISSISR